MSKSKAILVEGKDDESVITHLLSNKQRNNVEILRKGDDKKVLESIVSELNISGRKALGIVIDANSSYDIRWQQIRSRFNNAGIQLPKNPTPNGFVSDESVNYLGENKQLIRVGIWIMPDNYSEGELEDFLQSMIPDDDPIWPYSDSYIDEIPISLRKFKEKKKARAKVHAWLSAQKDPVLFGTAIHAKFLKTNGQLCQDFMSWLNRLLS